MSLDDVLGMSWAEFVLRSIGFREKIERERLLVREVAYQVYCSQFVWSKKKPKSKNKFWPITSDAPKRASIKAKNAFLNAFKKYKKKLNA